ncbi:MAG: PspC domain-containing protein [Candidatus Cryptobacteroides sp.]
MKKTENINLGGYAFVIEEDAYKVLSEYIDSIKASLKDDAEEITTDIEVRIAELLSEMCKGGTVVTLQSVRNVKDRIGNPEEISEEETAPEVNDKTKSPKKKMFRDMEGRCIGGVCSGLGMYFGIDPVFLRIVFVVLPVIGIFTRFEALLTIAVVGYAILWIVMPAARTVEEKCMMKGKPMRLENFISNGSGNNIKQEINDLSSSPALKKAGRIFVCLFGCLMMICGIAGLLGCIFIPTMPDLFDKFVNLRQLDFDTELAVASRIINAPGFWWLVTVVVALLCVWMLWCGTMLCFNFKAPSWKPGLVLFIAWMISILCLAGWVVKLVADMLPVLI